MSEAMLILDVMYDLTEHSIVKMDGAAESIAGHCPVSRRTLKSGVTAMQFQFASETALQEARREFIAAGFLVQP